jgi:hypothetical protein
MKEEKPFMIAVFLTEALVKVIHTQMGSRLCYNNFYGDEEDRRFFECHFKSKNIPKEE